MEEPSPATWGACRTCGAAVPPGAGHCPLCGADKPVAARDLPGVPPRIRRRLRLTRAVRAMIVVGVVAALGVALIPPALTGPPSVADPLTTQGTYALGPGGYAAVTGEITGGDYVLGNYTTVEPFGANVVLAVYNATGWEALVNHEPSHPVWSLPAQPSGRIVFSAITSDVYAFVLENPYPTTVGLSLKVYLTTTYESNVANDGFG